MGVFLGHFCQILGLRFSKSHVWDIFEVQNLTNLGPDFGSKNVPDMAFWKSEAQIWSILGSKIGPEKVSEIPL